MDATEQTLYEIPLSKLHNVTIGAAVKWTSDDERLHVRSQVFGVGHKLQYISDGGEPYLHMNGGYIMFKVDAPCRIIIKYKGDAGNIHDPYMYPERAEGDQFGDEALKFLAADVDDAGMRTVVYPVTVPDTDFDNRSAAGRLHIDIYVPESDPDRAIDIYYLAVDYSEPEINTEEMIMLPKNCEMIHSTATVLEDDGEPRCEIEEVVNKKTGDVYLQFTFYNIKGKDGQDAVIV